MRLNEFCSFADQDCAVADSAAVADGRSEVWEGADRKVSPHEWLVPPT